MPLYRCAVKRTSAAIDYIEPFDVGALESYRFSYPACSPLDFWPDEKDASEYDIVLRCSRRARATDEMQGTVKRDAANAVDGNLHGRHAAAYELEKNFVGSSSVDESEGGRVVERDR